jgi:hypothetical protein
VNEVLPLRKEDKKAHCVTKVCHPSEGQPAAHLAQLNAALEQPHKIVVRVHDARLAVTGYIAGPENRDRQAALVACLEKQQLGYPL